MKKWITLVVVLLAIAAVAVWQLRKPTRDASIPSGLARETSTTAAVPLLGLRLRVAVGDPSASAMLTVTLFNRASRQAALSRAADAGRAGQPAPPAPGPVRVDLTAAEWLSRIDIDELRADGTKARINAVTVRQAPSAVALENDVTAVVSLECPAGSLPAAGAKLVATFRSDSGPIESDPADVPPVAPPSTNALTAALADARVARIANDIDRLARAAAVIEQEAPSSVDAPYYRGLVQEARGERDAALASYRSALERMSRGRHSEPPDELVFLIRRLQGGRR